MNDFAILVVVSVVLFVEIFSVGLMSQDRYTFSVDDTQTTYTASDTDINYTTMSNDVPQGSTSAWKSIFYLFTLRSPFSTDGFPSTLGVVISFINYILIISGVWVGYRLIRSGAG